MLDALWAAFQRSTAADLRAICDTVRTATVGVPGCLNGARGVVHGYGGHAPDPRTRDTDDEGFMLKRVRGLLGTLVPASTGDRYGATTSRAFGRPYGTIEMVSGTRTPRRQSVFPSGANRRGILQTISSASRGASRTWTAISNRGLKSCWAYRCRWSKMIGLRRSKALKCFARRLDCNVRSQATSPNTKSTAVRVDG